MRSATGCRTAGCLPAISDQLTRAAGSERNDVGRKFRLRFLPLVQQFNRQLELIGEGEALHRMRDLGLGYMTCRMCARRSHPRRAFRFASAHSRTLFAGSRAQVAAIRSRSQGSHQEQSQLRSRRRRTKRLDQLFGCVGTHLLLKGHQLASKFRALRTSRRLTRHAPHRTISARARVGLRYASSACVRPRRPSLAQAGQRRRGPRVAAHPASTGECIRGWTALPGPEWILCGDRIAGSNRSSRAFPAGGASAPVLQEKCSWQGATGGAGNNGLRAQDSGRLAPVRTADPNQLAPEAAKARFLRSPHSVAFHLPP